MFSVYQKTLASPMYVNFWGQDSLSKASVLSTKSSAEEANRTEQSEISNGNEPDVVVLSGEGIKVSESLQKEKIDEVNQQLELDLSRYERLSVLSRDYLRYKG
ncbi:MAG: hypothetical protein LBQ66_07530, partial [Planctomycetaceae bacterium]|nr:hypothetical protein [Planctomycetaceae bacterium]